VNIPLEGVSVKDELSRRLGVPVWVDNDANVAALAEAQMVDDPPAEHLVMLTLGTGVGGGVIVDGRIFRGATGLGAELGHVVIESNGPNCPGRCPNRGCLEALVSGTALERDATELAEDFPESALGRVAAESVGRVRGRDVVRLAREGDDQSLRLMERLGTFLGVGIANVIQAFEPQYVVIGGGLSQGSDLFLDLAIREAEARSLPVLYRNVRIGVARGGPDAGVIGAGVLAMQEHSRSVDTAGQSQTATEGVE
jgi:glucokinase